MIEGVVPGVDGREDRSVTGGGLIGGGLTVFGGVFGMFRYVFIVSGCMFGVFGGGGGRGGGVFGVFGGEGGVCGAVFRLFGGVFGMFGGEGGVCGAVFRLFGGSGVGAWFTNVDDNLGRGGLSGRGPIGRR